MRSENARICERRGLFHVRVRGTRGNSDEKERERDTVATDFVVFRIIS